MVIDILLVDDSGPTREAIAAFLESEGYRVACAADGQEALERLRREVRPRLILLDLQMPRMNGPQFRAEQLKDPQLSSIPVAVYSASESVRFVASTMGVMHWLRKPVDSDALLAVVSAYCSGGGKARRRAGGRRRT